MFDYKDEFMALVDLYEIEDNTLRFQMYTEIENTFTDRLQARLLNELNDEQRESIFTKINDGWDPEEIIEEIFGMIEDVDTFVGEVFEEFKAEFKANMQI